MISFCKIAACWPCRCRSGQRIRACDHNLRRLVQIPSRGHPPSDRVPQLSPAVPFRQKKERLTQYWRRQNRRGRTAERHRQRFSTAPRIQHQRRGIHKLCEYKDNPRSLRDILGTQSLTHPQNLFRLTFAREFDPSLVARDDFWWFWFWEWRDPFCFFFYFFLKLTKKDDINKLKRECTTFPNEKLGFNYTHEDLKWRKRLILRARSSFGRQRVGFAKLAEFIYGKLDIDRTGRFGLAVKNRWTTTASIMNLYVVEIGNYYILLIMS